MESITGYRGEKKERKKSSVEIKEERKKHEIVERPLK
jgi:hypothetical protein